jgi:hypothetical protein
MVPDSAVFLYSIVQISGTAEKGDVESYETISPGA